MCLRLSYDTRLETFAKSPFLSPALLPNAHLLAINSALKPSWAHCDSFFIRPQIMQSSRLDCMGQSGADILASEDIGRHKVGALGAWSSGP